MEINAIQTKTGRVKADILAQARALVAEGVAPDRLDIVILPEVLPLWARMLSRNAQVLKSFWHREEWRQLLF